MGLRDRLRRLEREAEEEMFVIPQKDGTVARFPIVMRGPNIAPEQTSEAMVQNIDLRLTFEEIANATSPSYEDGQSFLATATTGALFSRNFAYGEYLGVGGASWRAVYTAETAYHKTGNFEEFYDLTRDPYQLDGRIDTLEEALVGAHREALAQMSKCKGAECRTVVP